MPTFANMVNRVKQYVYGFSQNQQQWSMLTNSIGATDTTFMVNDATQVTRGLIEIDGTELMVVQSVNQQTNMVTIYPWSRGWAGTTATSHAANARIENNPQFPTVRVKEAINDVIQSVYPDLFAVGTTKIIKLAPVWGYAMPADAEEVLDVKYQVIGPSMQYPHMRRWRFEGQADTTDYPTGKAIWLGESVTPGREMFITYRKEPSILVNDSDDYTTVTGLPTTSADVVLYGACMKLEPVLETMRELINTVEESERSAFTQIGQVSKVSTYYGQLFAQRLQVESRKQQDIYQTPTHFSY